ncbi:MAG: hypothetical protein M3081_02105 [Gemmatimonadota bacterium]|nr:hypothetical protein [Gemmatimonadota bacterium]
MIIGKLAGSPYYDEMRRRILEPLGLRSTVSFDRARVPGLVQGYAGRNNPLDGTDAMLDPEWRDGSQPVVRVRTNTKTEKMEVVHIPTDSAVVRHMVSDVKRGRLWLALNGTGRIGKDRARVSGIT